MSASGLTTEPSIETVEAVSYENEDGTLYGYANHKDWAGNPGAVPVRFMRERDYEALRSALTAEAEHAGRMEAAIRGFVDYANTADSETFPFIHWDEYFNALVASLAKGETK